MSGTSATHTSPRPTGCASSTSGIRACTSFPTASRCARECRSRRCESDCTRSRTSPTWCPIGPLTTTAPGASACPIASCLTCSPASTTWSSTRRSSRVTSPTARCGSRARARNEVLISTYVCHPSLANDNLSGIAVATMLARELSQRRLRHSYRFLFAPGTIGPLAWLHQNRDTLHRVKHGLTVSCIGDAGGFTYKRSRRRRQRRRSRRRARAPRLRRAHIASSTGSPGAATSASSALRDSTCPVGCLMRTPHGGFAGYHTSADGLDRIRPESLGEAVRVGLDVVEVLETNRTCMNLSPYGEPQLGRRGLYRSSGGAVRVTGRRARAAVGAQPERRAGVAGRHRRAVGAALRGHRASSGAAGAGRACWRRPRAWLVVGPRPISLRDDPLLAPAATRFRRRDRSSARRWPPPGTYSCDIWYATSVSSTSVW